MARKYFSNTAVATTLSASISDSDSSLTVNSSTGYPAVPFVIAINAGTSSEEVIKVGAKSGTTFSTLTRGHDGSTARAHTSGASVKHVAAAEDFTGLWTHTHATSDGHANIPLTNTSGTLPTTKGGTGLTSLGSAKQVIKVNDAGNALEFGNAEAILNIDGMTDGSGITIVDDDDFAISDGGTEKKVNASQIKAYVGPKTDEEIQDIVGAMLTGNTETRISVTYEDGDGTIDFVVDDMTADTNTQLSTEQVQDIVGAMFSGNTETRISATYEDGDGTIDLVVDDMTANDNTQLSTEAVQDIVGAMFTGNTETNITVTYEDSDGTIDLVATGNTTEQIQDIVGAMFSSNTETGITATYEDSDGTIDLVVSADSAAILDGDSDFTISDGVANGIHYELDNTDMANWNQGGIALTTAGGIFKHHQTQAATYTIASTEGTVLAGPITITGTITNSGTMVIL